MPHKTLVGTLRATYDAWNAHDAPRLGAALAFYSLLSLSPLVVLVTAIAGLVFGRTIAQQQVLADARSIIGSSAVGVIQDAIASAQGSSSTTLASIIGLVTLLIGASGVFTELQDDLNMIWGLRSPSGGGFRRLLRERFYSFGMVLAVGFLLVVSLVVSTVLAALGKFFSGYLPLPESVLNIFNFLISLAGITVCFGLIFKYVPDTRVSWHPVWKGAAVTALLFTIGKSLIAIYLGRAAIGSPYGAAGSLVVLIAWVYYSAMIFLFGAEFTYVLSTA